MKLIRNQHGMCIRVTRKKNGGRLRRGAPKAEFREQSSRKGTEESYEDRGRGRTSMKVVESDAQSRFSLTCPRKDAEHF